MSPVKFTTGCVIRISIVLQMWYETNRDIASGEELILGPREPLQLQDVLGDSVTSDDRSDRETGWYILKNLIVAR